MMVSLISMLKTSISPEKSTSKWLGVGDNKVNRFGIGGGIKYAKKLEKMFKSRNLAKSRKMLSKSGNSTNFNTTETRPKFLTLNATEVGPKFLTLDARTVFNRLWLAFIKALIL